MLIVGLGGASTLASVPSAFESVDVIELEPEVVEANRRAAPRRGGDPFAHPRVKLHLGDARGALVLTDQRFDAIVSQPSHPWTSGASHLYTREFFDLVRQHLTPGGVFVQWIGIQFLDDELLRGMLTTLLDVFPHLEVYRPLPAVLIFAGSEAPLDTIGNSARTLAQHRDEWRDLSIRCPEDVAAALVLTTAEARALAGDAAPNRDDHNRLASGAHIADGAQRAIQALVAEDPIARLASGLDLARLSQRLTSIDLVPRVQRLAQASRAADRELVRAWAALTLGRRMEAARSFEQALSAGASAEEIASGLRLAKRADGEVAGEPASARALAAGWRAEAVADWPAVAQLDPLLAVIAPPDPLFPEVARLRARARLAESGTAAGEAALEILRPLLLTESSFSDFLLWGRAAAKAGQSELAWAAIDRVSQGLTPAHAALRRETVELMDRLPEHPQSERIRAQLRRGPH
jgi:tetratricopeptide (TPR) repeat protein